jgi:quercetin dioxygenase-like cupin family protein
LRIKLGLLAACVSFTALAQAQEQKSAPGAVAPLLENDRVRVFEMHFKPGEKLSARAHTPHLMYMLTDGTLVFSEDGKRPYEMIFRAGEAVWVPAQARAAENGSEKEVRALVVEVKQPPAPAAVAKKAKRKAKRRAATAAEAPTAQKQ